MSAQRVPGARGVWGLGLFGGLLLLGVSSAQAADPTDKTQCMSMTRAPLEAECERLFGQSEQSDALENCLGVIEAQLDVVCEQFFGEGQDFCAVCTQACTDNFEPQTEPRTACLRMCVEHAACQ